MSETIANPKSILTTAMENAKAKMNERNDNEEIDPIAKKASTRNAIKRGAIFAAVAAAVTIIAVKYIHTPVGEEETESTDSQN